MNNLSWYLIVRKADKKVCLENNSGPWTKKDWYYYPEVQGYRTYAVLTCCSVSLGWPVRTAWHIIYESQQVHLRARSPLHYRQQKHNQCLRNWDISSLCLTKARSPGVFNFKTKSRFIPMKKVFKKVLFSLLMNVTSFT